MRVLVTGGGGFLGRYIVEQLLARKYHVRVFSRSNYPELEKLGVEVLQGNITDKRAVDRACHDIDLVFHTAAKVGVFGPYQEFYDANVIGTKNIIRSCQAFRIRRLIFSSSSSVVYDGKNQLNVNESAPYPAQYLSPYSETKAIAEKLVLEANATSGILTCALRPHLIWGPRDKYIVPRILAQAKAGKLRIVGNGKNLTDITYVVNAAQAHLQAADQLKAGSAVPGQAYFITQGTPVVMWEWINKLLELYNLPPIRKHVSAKLAYAIGSLLERAYSFFKIKTEPPMTRIVALQLSTTHTYSIEKAKKDFGYEPKISTEEGLQKLISTLT